MAQRFGGKYSADSHSDTPQSLPKKKRRDRRLSLYRALSFPIAIAGIVSVFAGSFLGFIGAISAFFLINFAIEVMGAGLQAEAAYSERKIARPPRYPRKLIASGIMGVAIFLGLNFAGGFSISSALGFAGIAVASMLLSFGFDPMRSKGHEGYDRRTTERAIEAIERAQEKVDALRNQSRQFRNRHYKNAIERLAMSAEDMFRSVEDDPEDYRNVRRYLSVYLDGANQATERFQTLSAPTKEDEKKFLALLDELDRGFRAQQAKMAKGENQNMNIEIDVLRERLAAEGIKPKE